MRADLPIGLRGSTVDRDWLRLRSPSAGRLGRIVANSGVGRLLEVG
jgi:hypothetical protein